MKILLIDNDQDIGILVQKSLEPYHVDHVFSAQEARSYAQNINYDLFIISAQLPDTSGFDLCLAFSSDPSLLTIPIIILSALDQKSEMIYGLNNGADDYLIKPVNGAELKARIDARLRRQKRINRNIYRNDLFQFDLEFLTCKYLSNKEPIDLDLTPTEFRILLTLVQNQGNVLTREDLIRLLWKHCGINIQQRGIDSHVAHIRKKMGPHGKKIVALYGRGYCFKKEET